MEAEDSLENDYQEFGENLSDSSGNVDGGNMEVSNPASPAAENNSLLSASGDDGTNQMEEFTEENNIDSLDRADVNNSSVDQDAEMAQLSSNNIDSDSGSLEDTQLSLPDNPQSPTEPCQSSVDFPQSPLGASQSPELPKSSSGSPFRPAQAPQSPNDSPQSPQFQEPDSFGSSHPVRSGENDSDGQNSDHDENVDSRTGKIAEEDNSTSDNQISEAECLNPSNEEVKSDAGDVPQNTVADDGNSGFQAPDNTDDSIDKTSINSTDEQCNEAQATTEDQKESSESVEKLPEEDNACKLADSTGDFQGNSDETAVSQPDTDSKCDTNTLSDAVRVPYAEEIRSPDDSFDSSPTVMKLAAGAEPIESDESDSEILHMPDQSTSSSVHYGLADSNARQGSKSALYKNSYSSSDRSQFPDASGYNSEDDTLDLEPRSPGDSSRRYSRPSGKFGKNIPHASASDDEREVTASGQADSGDKISGRGRFDKSGVNGSFTVDENKRLSCNRQTANTSFNEEHVELDYDEEEDEGQRSEHEEGEMRSDDEQDMDKSDDGEIEDDEDCEEGEIREPGSKKPFVKPTCRFYVKGNCTWGDNCRFLHPGVNDKGNYSLIERPGFNVIMGPRGQYAKGWPNDLGPEPELPPPPPPAPDVPVIESAWERGLRQAKEMKKKASQRKETEIDFEEKRLNLNLDDVPDKEFNKENERHRYKDPYYDAGYDEPDEYYDQPHGFQPGQYENFEVRWTRGPDVLEDFRDKERYKEKHFPPSHVERLYRPDSTKLRSDTPRDPRDSQPPPPRGRADEWRDPWQRSKSPIKKKGPPRNSRPRRRHRSHSSSSRSSSFYSSSGSRSFSSSSSGSSFSRDSSFSGSSASRSRSRSPGMNKRPPPREMGRGYPPRHMDRRGGGGAGPVGPPPHPQDSRPPVPFRNMEPRSAVTIKSQRSPDRRRAPPPLPLTQRNVQALGGRKERRPRTGSHSSSGSSRSSSSRSISSVSSHTSSSSSSGSADSQHLYRDLDSPSKGSKPGGDRKKSDSRRSKKKLPTDPHAGPPGKAPRQTGRPDVASRQGQGTPVKAKDPLKLVGQKSNIKLTLLSKGEKGGDMSATSKRRMGEVSSGAPPPKKQAISPAVQVPVDKVKPAAGVRAEKAKSPVKDKTAPTAAKVTSKPAPPSVKSAPVAKAPAAQAASPSASTAAAAAAAAAAKSKDKKSNSSRREELLKQLKAVEDAIARKKSKMQ